MIARAEGQRAIAEPVPIGGLLQLLASIVLLSSAWPLTKIAVAAGSTPLWFAEGRAVLSGLTAVALLAALGRLRLPVRADLPAMFAIGGLQIGLYLVLAHEAVAWVPAGRTAILANTTTIWVVPLSLIFLRDNFRRQVVGGRPGIGWRDSADQSAGNRLDVGQRPYRPHLFAGCGPRLVDRHHRHPSGGTETPMLELLPWCFLVGSIILAPLLWWHAPDGSLGHATTSWWALAYIGLIAGPLGTWCIMEATAKLPTLVSSVGFLTTPAISLILANIFLHEPFTADLLAGSALIMAGVGFAAWPRGRTARAA